MRKVKSYKKGVEERNAYCTECKWSDHTLKANIKGRNHAQKTGHQVDIYTETRVRIK